MLGHSRRRELSVDSTQVDESENVVGQGVVETRFSKQSSNLLG
jgi:hypothetical protein